MPQFLRIDEVCALVGLSKGMVYALMRQNRFPRSIKLGAPNRAGAVRWDRDTLAGWMKAQAAGAAETPACEMTT